MRFLSKLKKKNLHNGQHKKCSVLRFWKFYRIFWRQGNASGSSGGFLSVTIPSNKPLVKKNWFFMFLSLLGLLYLDLKKQSFLNLEMQVESMNCYTWGTLLYFVSHGKNWVLYGFHLKWMLQLVKLTFQSFLCNLENIWAILKITRKLVHKIELSCSFIFTYTLDHFSSDIKKMTIKYN